jgi:hypothetical protein
MTWVVVGPSTVTVVRSVVVAVHSVTLEIKVSVTVTVLGVRPLSSVTVAVHELTVSVIVAVPPPSPSIVIVTVVVGPAVALYATSLAKNQVKQLDERRWNYQSLTVTVGT